MAQAALAAAQAAASIASGILDMSRAKKQMSYLETKGKLYERYYEDQVAANRLATARKTAYGIGSDMASAGAQGQVATGSAWESAFDGAFNTAFAGLDQRSGIRSQQKLQRLSTAVDIWHQQQAITDGMLKAISGGLIEPAKNMPVSTSTPAATYTADEMQQFQGFLDTGIAATG